MEIHKRLNSAVSSIRPEGMSIRTFTVLLAIYIVTLSVAILFFNQPGDLRHTVGSSNAILHGHILDFYDYNKTFFGGNDYLPTVYFIFAAWMSPLALLGVLSPEGVAMDITTFELFWSKLLLLVGVFCSTYAMTEVSRVAFPESKSKQQLVNLAFALSPYLIFAPLVFGQYDILSVFFTLIGVLGFLRKKTVLFVLGFAVAFSLKYFALLLFVPLALFYFAKKRHIVLALISVGSIVVVEVIFYWNNDAFVQQTIFGLFSGKVNNSYYQKIQIFIGLLYIAFCALVFFARNKNFDRTKVLVFCYLAAFIPLFEAVDWHPQWIVLTAPAFALSLGLMKRPAWFLLWESLAFVFFIIFVATGWPLNVDGSMIVHGPLSFFDSPPLLFVDIVPRQLRVIATVAMAGFFLSPLLWLALESIVFAKSTPQIAPRKFVWFIRALLVPVVFIAPSVALASIPDDAAERFSASAMSRTSPAFSARGESDTRTVVNGHDEIVQRFTADVGVFKGLSLRTSSTARRITGDLHIALQTKSGNEIFDTLIDASTIRNDESIFFLFEDPYVYSGGELVLLVTQTSNESESAVGFWLKPLDANPGFSEMYSNQSQVDGVLDFTIYYSEQR
jgi:hypothetical protein